MENKILSKEIADCKNAYLKGRIVPDKAIAEASFTVLDEYRWRPGPSQPKKVQEYYADPAKKKACNANPEKYLNFWEDTLVKKYFDDNLRVKNLNDVNKNWLKWMKDVLFEDEAKVAAIDVQLYKFTDDYSKSIEQPRWQ